LWARTSRLTQQREGAGKSTLCASLPADRWTRVNQDSINKGSRGTRKQCLTAAAAAMRCGHHVVVDRCGLTVEQRQVNCELRLR
jgi:aprataxin